MQHGGAQAFTDRLDEIISGLEGVEEMRAEKTRLLYIHSKLGHALDELLVRPEQGQIAGQRFMKSMATALGYALLCEEAQHELEAYNDMSKQLIAGAYYDEHYGDGLKPSLEKSALHKHFNAVAQDLPISPAAQPPKPKI